VPRIEVLGIGSEVPHCSADPGSADRSTRHNVRLVQDHDPRVANWRLVWHKLRLACAHGLGGISLKSRTDHPIARAARRSHLGVLLGLVSQRTFF
jgi:hypothetical protein